MLGQGLRERVHPEHHGITPHSLQQAAAPAPMDYSRDQLSIAGALLRIVTQRDIAEMASNFGYSQKGSEPYDGRSPRPRPHR